MKSYQICFCLSLWLTIVLAARADQLSPNCATNPPNFLKLSYNDAGEAVISEEDSIVSGTKKICPEYITNLVSQIKQGQLSGDNHGLALDLLGRLHSDNSCIIEFLIQEIDFQRTRFDPPDRFSIQLKYPAQQALMSIGTPVIKPILSHLSDENNSLRQTLMCEILIQIEGRKGNVFNGVNGKIIAQDQIEKLLATELNITKRANLKAVLKILAEMSKETGLL